MRPRDLTMPERALWRSFPRGEWVDLRDGDPGVDDPGEARHWGDGRVVRAEVIAALLLGALDPEPGRVAALRLRGACITGRLDVSNSSIGVALYLGRCRLD